MLARIGLRDEHFVDIDAQTRGVRWIEGMFRVDECHNAAKRLRLGENLQCERRFTTGLRTVNLNNTAARNAANAECRIERQSARGNSGNLKVFGIVAELHDGALAEFLLDLLSRELEHFLFVLSLSHCISLPPAEPVYVPRSLLRTDVLTSSAMRK